MSAGPHHPLDNERCDGKRIRHAKQANCYPSQCFASVLVRLKTVATREANDIEIQVHFARYQDAWVHQAFAAAVDDGAKVVLHDVQRHASVVFADVEVLVETEGDHDPALGSVAVWILPVHCAPAGVDDVPGEGVSRREQQRRQPKEQRNRRAEEEDGEK